MLYKWSMQVLLQNYITEQILVKKNYQKQPFIDWLRPSDKLLASCMRFWFWSENKQTKINSSLCISTEHLTVLNTRQWW